MYLRVLEERRKFTYYRLSQSEREEISRRLTRFLSNREEVLLAIIFGGFIDSEIFRDIDLAIYTMYKVPIEEEYMYEYMLSEKLTMEIGVPVDTILLDYTPLNLRRKVLSKGRVIYEKYGWVKTKLDYTLLRESVDIEIKRRKALSLL